MKQFSLTLLNNQKITVCPFLIFGILNITPDSFFDQGLYFKPKLALKRAYQMYEEAENFPFILDIGAESTRPESSALSSQKEITRLKSVLPLIKENIPEIIISVDTYHSETAAFALNNGADLINDVSGFNLDKNLKAIISDLKPGYILSHCPENISCLQDIHKYNYPEKNTLEQVFCYFERKLEELIAKGLPEQNIILDLGIGFGKTSKQSLGLLENIELFSKFNLPLLIGISNKSIFADLLGLSKEKREIASQVAIALLAKKGIWAHRVHNVKLTKQTLQLVNFLP